MVYLDYAATTPILPEVLEAMIRAEKEFFANASALHTPGHRAKNAIEHARKLLAEAVGADPAEIIFTSGASESNNTVIHTFAGHEIEASPLEHHSIIEPARQFSGQKTPKLYSYMLANNETGEILGLSKIIEQAHAENAFIHSDLTQVLGKIPLNVHELGLDYATFSAHKIGGPAGVGALFVRTGAPFSPLIIGGNQEHGRRGGTYNTVGIVGFGKALEIMLEQQTWQKYNHEIRELRDDLARRLLAEIPGCSLNTDIRPSKSLPNILNASFQAAEGESIQLYLDAKGIIVSTGSACAAGDAKPSHVLMAKTGDAEVAHSSIRFSFGLENTRTDIEEVMRVLPPIINRLQQISTINTEKK